MMGDIMKILENSGVLIKGITKPLEMNQKNQEVDFLVHSFDIIGASLLGNMLADNGVVRASDEAIQAGDGVIRA